MYLEEQQILLCGIDHGFSTMKTAHFVFENGVKELGGEATLTTNTMMFNDRYYKVGEGRLPLKDTKVEDEDYFLLTLAAIAKEMDYYQLSDADVCIAAGLPFTRFGQEKVAFKEYLNPGSVDFQYNGKAYHIECKEVFLYPQCYAAVADRLGKLPAELLIVDIGSKTVDIIHTRKHVPVESDCSFEDEFKRMNKTINLDINYRTTPNIVNILNAIYNDKDLTQKPYKMNLDSDMEFHPRVVFTDNIDRTLSNFVLKHKDALVLFLTNKERFYGIGAGNLFDAVNNMDRYKFGKKYTAVDVLTKEEVRNEDILFKMVFLLCDIVDNYENKQYGEVFRSIRKNTKIFNANKYLVKEHSNKKRIKDHLDKLIYACKTLDATIGGVIRECNELEFLTKEYYEEVVGNEDYQQVLDVKMMEIRNLIGYLRNPKISTQHGVKGESHNTVVFVAENSSSTPIVHMNKFFEIWSKMDITLADFDTFYYSYLKMVQNVESVCGVKYSEINKEIYEKKESKIIEILNKYTQINKDDDYYINLLQTHMEKYFKKPNVTNLKPCIRESTVYGTLSAYRLFYVGCSRARRNLEIIIKNDDVSAFKELFSVKLTHCGFDVIQAEQE